MTKRQLIALMATHLWNGDTNMRGDKIASVAKAIEIYTEMEKQLGAEPVGGTGGPS